MALRKGQAVAEVAAPLVRIAEVLTELGGGTNPNAWHAEGMRGQVTRDWRGHPCLSWVDAERLYLHILRDREQASREQSERLAELEGSRPRFLGAGVFVGEEATL